MKHLGLFCTSFFLLLIGSIFSPAWAVNEVGPNRAYFLVHNYQHDWLTYSKQYDNFIPYSRGIHEDELSFSLFIDLLKNSKYELLISTSEENVLFIEGALQKKLEPDQWLTLDIDSLKRVYRKDELLITIYGSPGVEDKTVYIGHARKNINQQDSGNSRGLSLINIKPINTTPFQDFSILVFILVLILAAFNYSTSLGSFRRFIRVADFFDRSERNDFYTFNKPYTRVILVNSIILSLVISYIFLFFTHYGIDFFDTRSFLTEESTLLELTTDLAKLTMAILLSLAFRYFLMGTAASILNLSRIVNAHYIKSLQVSFLFWSLVFILCFGISINYPLLVIDMQTPILYTFISFYLVRFILLFVFTNSGPLIINLYLFSYLCVVEIIPLIIGVKLTQVN